MPCQFFDVDDHAFQGGGGLGVAVRFFRRRSGTYDVTYGITSIDRVVFVAVVDVANESGDLVFVDQVSGGHRPRSSCHLSDSLRIDASSAL